MGNLRDVRRPRLSSIERYFDRMFHDRFRSLFPEGDDSSSLIEWAPAVDIKEEAERFVIRADLPGVDPKDVEVTLDNGVLSIRGERQEEKEEDRAGYHRSERFHGSFFRRFALAGVVDDSGVSARSDKGVLEIVVPKSEQAKVRRIPVTS